MRVVEYLRHRILGPGVPKTEVVVDLRPGMVPAASLLVEGYKVASCPLGTPTGVRLAVRVNARQSPLGVLADWLDGRAGDERARNLPELVAAMRRPVSHREVGETVPELAAQKVRPVARPATDMCSGCGSGTIRKGRSRR